MTVRMAGVLANPINPNGINTLLSLAPPVTVANTAAETTIASVTLPASYFYLGLDLRIGGMGFHSAVANPTVRVRVYKGAVLLLDTGINNSGNTTNAFVELRGHITGQSSTSVWSQGYYSEASAAGTPYNQFPMVNTAANTISAASEVLKVTFQWGTASPSNTITWSNLAIYEANVAH